MNTRILLYGAAALVVLGLGFAVRGKGPASPGPARPLVIKGSDTMVNLSQAWAEAFMKKNPDVSISVTGGGSGTGIAAILNKTCDIANASRAMTTAEHEDAKANGILPDQVKCALDGLAVAVSDKNPILSLTLAQLKLIYTGKVVDWKELGGTPGKIVVLSRENNSGTYVFFQDHVLDKEPFKKDCLFLPSTKAITQELAGGTLGIGYGGIAYFKGQKGVKILPIATKEHAPVEPTDETVLSGKYPISRQLFMYTKFQPSDAVLRFVQFCQSAEGQKIVETVGYVPVKTRTGI